MSPGRDHRFYPMFVLALALSLNVTACAKGDTGAPSDPAAGPVPAPPSEAVTPTGAPAKTPEASGHTPTTKKAPVAPIPKDAVEVEASCGQCNFGLTEPMGCDLAVRIKGKAYFVDGAHIDDHGDAHAARGMCNAVRRAAVTGQVVDNRYQATTFRLLD